MTQRDRALGAFYGLALGDALGMPTQSFSRADIVARVGHFRSICRGQKQCWGLVFLPAGQAQGAGKAGSLRQLTRVQQQKAPRAGAALLQKRM